MNRNRYRIIFNAHRGQRMVVSESSRSTGKGNTTDPQSASSPSGASAANVAPNGVSPNPHTWISRPLRNAIALLLMVGQISPALAQVIADPTAPANQRATILKDAQGRPLVNIQTPSAAGLSRNTYSQFDVSTLGLLLNNSASNPWLSNGVTAKIILNEVNGTGPSQIKGPVTVQGANAQVIIANPKGINIDGGSFINANRVTLSTGKPIVSNGSLTGYTVQGGNITIQAGGLNNSATPYTDILTRTLSLAGQIKAQDLSVTTGLQTIDPNNGLITAQNTTPNPTPNTLSIDTAALGGMYANNISLLATEAGVGVRNLGTWQAKAGQIIVTADGQLTNQGTIQAKVTSLATVNGDITNSGPLLGDQALVVSAGGNLNIQGTGLVQNTGSTLILNANKNIQVQNTSTYGNAKILSTEAGGQLSLSAGQHIQVDAGSTVAAHRSVQLSSDGTLSLNTAKVIATEGDVTVLAAKDMTVTNTEATGQHVHLETGAAFDGKTLGHIRIEGGNIRGSAQTSVMASGNIKVTGNGGTPISGGGHVDLYAEKTLAISSNTTLTAQQHMSLGAGEQVYLYGNNTQHVTATAGGNLLVGANNVELQSSKLKAGNNLEVQAYNGALRQFAMRNTEGSAADRVQLSAGNTLSLSTYNGKTYLSGIQGTAKNINIVGNGQTQLVGVALKQGSDSTWLSNELTALDSLTLANLNNTVEDCGCSSRLETQATTLKAGGKASLLANGQVVLNSQASTVGGKTTAAAVSITAGSIDLQGKSFSAYGSQLTTNGDQSTASKNGNINLIATDTTAHLTNSFGDQKTQLNATGSIRLHAQGNLTTGYLRAKAAGNLQVSSAGGTIIGVGNMLEARDQLSFGSQGAQTHVDSTYKGGLTHLYNKTGNMTLADVQAIAYGTTTASLSKQGAQVSVESGGSISMDAPSYLLGKTGVTFIQGQGDITINPTGATKGTVTWGQVSSSGTTTLVAKNGNINLTGTAGTTGAGTSQTVNISTVGNLNLAGKNVNLQASSLFVDGVLNIDATQGNVTASALRETQDGNTVAWKGSYVRGAKGLNIHAASTISFDGATGRSTAGSVNLQSDGAINTQNSSITAFDLLSATSAKAQNHTNTTFQGGVTSLYNTTGAMSLNTSRVYAVGTSTTSMASISGKASVESGGTFGMDANSRINGTTSSTVILGQGDIVLGNTNIQPSATQVGALAWNQVSSNSMNLVTRNGNIVLKGQEGSNGAGSATYQTRSTTGDLNLVGNNVTLEGTTLFADGTLNITATQGNFVAKGLKETQTKTLGGDPMPHGKFGSTQEQDIGWKNVVLSGKQGVNIRAAGNIAMDSTRIQSDNTVNVQAGGNLSMAGNYNHTTTESMVESNAYQRLEIKDLNGSQILASKGITLGAMGGDLNLSATKIFGQTGPVTLQALGDINLEAAQRYQRRDLHRHGNYGGGISGSKAVDIYNMDQSLRNDPIWVSGQNILVKAGNNINTYGTQFKATGNLTLQAGDAINYYGVYDQTESIENYQEQGHSWRGSKDVNNTNTLTKLTGQPTLLQSQQDIVSQSGANQLLQGTKVVYGGTASFQAGVGEKARADAKVILEGLKNTTSQTRKEKSESTFWQKTVDQGSVIETLAPPTFSGPQGPVFQAPGGLTVQIPEGNLKTEISKLMTQPGMEYLKTLADRKDINWQPVKLAHEQWNYEQEGLTGAGAALVAIAVAMVMPAGVGALGGLVTNATAVTMTSAAINSLAIQASVSLINNQGNLSKTFKELGSSRVIKSTIAAALTAGVLKQLGGTDFMKGLDNIDATLTEKVTYNLINASTRSITNAAINGGSLTDALKEGLLQGLIDSAHGQAASKIKLLEGDYIIHKLAHALAGCAAGAAAGGSCKDGAIGAAVAEMTAELFSDQKPSAYASDTEIENYNKKVKGYSQLAAGTVAALAGGNAQTAINTADAAVSNNFLTFDENQLRKQAAEACKAGNTKACADEKRWDTLDLGRDQQVKKACATDASSQSCKDWRDYALYARSSYINNGLSGSEVALDHMKAGRFADIQELQSIQKLLNNTPYSYLSQAPQSIQMLAGIVADFLPLVGDVKAIQEAKDPFDYTMAVIGALGPVGDGAVKAIKAAKAAHQAGDTAEVIKQLTRAEQIAQSSKSGKVFEKSGLEAMGIDKNTKRVTVTTKRGETITIIPDAVVDGAKSTLVEFKNVINITDTRQFRGYEATKQPIILVVSERTQTISDRVKTMVFESGGGTGEIRVFNQVTSAWSNWK